MKKTKLFITIFVLTGIMFSCSSDDDSGSREFDGSIQSLEEFYNPELVAALEELGFKINQGNTPPNVEGSYFSSPFILQESNIPEDTPNHVFSDYTSTFSNQDVNSLTVDFIGNNGDQIDEGDGSLISGENKSFSVYLKNNTQIGSSIMVSTAIAISGIMTDEGIEDFQYAILMLDDKGDPDEVYIENNTGRLIHDSDGFSPKN